MEHFHQWQDRESYLLLIVHKEWDLEIVRVLYKDFERLFDETRHKHFVVNTRNVDYLDSLALGFLVNASKKVETVNGYLVILEPRENLRKVIHDTGLESRFKLFDNEENLQSFVEQ